MPLFKNRKKKLRKRAAKAHARAEKRGDTPVGTRKGPSSPRTLSNTEIPVYKREQKILDKVPNVKGPKEKKKKNGWVKKIFTFEKNPGKSTSSKIRKGIRKQRNKRKHSSCKKPN
jgi:hypothetical protein